MGKLKNNLNLSKKSNNAIFLENLVKNILFYLQFFQISDYVTVSINWCFKERFDSFLCLSKEKK